MSDHSINPEFDAFAADYDDALNQGLSISGEDKNYFANARLEHLAKILAKLPLTAYNIMDFGCGTGSATPFALESFPHARTFIGTDISEKSLAIARSQKVSGSQKVSDTFSPRYQLMSAYTPSQSLDLVFCNGVFHHIPLANRAHCLNYIKDSLRPGGLLALFENNPWNPGTRLVMARIPFDKDAITLSPPTARSLLRAGGFHILRTDSLFYFPRFLKFLRPAEKLLHKIPLGAQYLVLAQKPPQ